MQENQLQSIDKKSVQRKLRKKSKETRSLVTRVKSL